MITRTDIGKFSYFFPCIATIVTSHFEGRDNAMAVGWHMPLSAEPPLYGVGIAPGKLSHAMITGSREFGVNFLPLSKAELIAATGGPSGKTIDKFKVFKLEKTQPVKTDVPILSDAYAAFECRLEEERSLGDHSLFVGRVVAVHLAEGAYGEKNTLNLDQVKPALYMGSDNYLDILTYRVSHLGRGETARKMMEAGQ